MKRLRLGMVIFSAPLVALALAGGGCSNSGTTTGGGGGGPVVTDTGKGVTKAADLKAYQAKGTGTLKGKATFQGTLPERKIAVASDHKDKDYCLKAPKDEQETQQWKGKDGGVKDVVVWVRPPSGYFFDVPENLRKPTKPATLDQPFCAFEPHVQVLFADYVDPQTRKLVSTGQTFKVLNSAAINHNTKMAASKEPNADKAFNEVLPPKPKDGKPAEKDVDLRSGKRPNQEDLVTFNCNIHPWMSAYAWVLDHPYAAVTNEDGTYEIKDVPAGAEELEVVYWHEGFDKPKSAKIKINTGDNTKDFQITP